MFPGLDYEKDGLVMDMIMRRKVKKYGVPEGYCRDWEKIRAWAASLQPRLLPGRVGLAG